MPFARSLSFCVLTYSSRCTLQDVSAPHTLAVFLYCLLVLPNALLQYVSAPGFPTSCPCPHLSPPMCSPGCEFPSLLLSYRILTCASRFALQDVSARCSLAFFSCPLRFLPVIMCSLACECPSLAHFLFYVLTFRFCCVLQVVSASRSLTFFPVLTCRPWCALQEVSTPRLLGFFSYPYLSLPMSSPDSECPSLAGLLSMSLLVHPDVLSRT